MMTAALLAGCGERAVPAASAVASAVAIVGESRPVDEAASDASFLAFRDSLLRIVAQRDTTAL